MLFMRRMLNELQLCNRSFSCSSGFSDLFSAAQLVLSRLLIHRFVLRPLLQTLGHASRDEPRVFVLRRRNRIHLAVVEHFRTLKQNRRREEHLANRRGAQSLPLLLVSSIEQGEGQLGDDGATVERREVGLVLLLKCFQVAQDVEEEGLLRRILGVTLLEYFLGGVCADEVGGVELL